VKFGVFSLLSVPEKQLETKLVRGELEINCYAEDAGFDSVWLAEHSGSRYGLICSPQVMAAAIAARTKRIRIGTAVNVLPLHQPLRIANDFAMVDVLSGGRLNKRTVTGSVKFLRSFSRLGPVKTFLTKERTTASRPPNPYQSQSKSLTPRFTWRPVVRIRWHGLLSTWCE
jgi:hypothetical protein